MNFVDNDNMTVIMQAIKNALDNAGGGAFSYHSLSYSGITPNSPLKMGDFFEFDGGITTKSRNESIDLSNNSYDSGTDTTWMSDGILYGVIVGDYMQSTTRHVALFVGVVISASSYSRTHPVSGYIIYTSTSSYKALFVQLSTPTESSFLGQVLSNGPYVQLTAWSLTLNVNMNATNTYFYRGGV